MAFVEPNEAITVPEPAVLSYTTIVPAVPPVTVINPRHPEPLLRVVVVAVDIAVLLYTGIPDIVFPDICFILLLALRTLVRQLS